MQSKALAGAVGAAIAGAAIWAAVSFYTGYEIGWIAWGIGALVGGAAALLGSDGVVSGGVCAGLALAAILVGKLAATHFLIEKELQNAVQGAVTQDLYDAYAADAAAFTDVKDASEYPQFMVDNAYTDASSPEGVLREDLEAFEQFAVPRLRAIGNPPMPYDEWQAWERAYITDFGLREFPLFDSVIESLGLIDLVFAALGLATAFKLGAGLVGDA